MMQQCLTCTRRNIPPEQVSCPACGSVDLRGYDPETEPLATLVSLRRKFERDNIEKYHEVRPSGVGVRVFITYDDYTRMCEVISALQRGEKPEPWRYDPESDGGEGDDLDREQTVRIEREQRLEREGDV